MQSYLFALAIGATRNIPADGNLFVYESVSAAAGDDRIILKPENGAEITLRPGQKVRSTERVQNWFVRAYDPLVPVAGVVVIGSGDFSDAALGKMVKLDGAYNNNVEINNTTAKRIPISIDETQTQKTTANIVTYTNSYYFNGPVPQCAGFAANPVKVLDASVNVNGVILSRVRIRGVYNATPGIFVLMARTGSVCAGTMDGDPLRLEPVAGGASFDLTQNLASDGQVRVPAGKSVWLWSEYQANPVSVQILYQVL